MFQGIQINAIDAVLNFPANLSTTLASIPDLSGFDTLTNQITVQVPSINSTTNETSNSTVLEVLESLHGFTLFAPNNEALKNATPTLSGLTNNMTAISDILRNHVGTLNH